MERRVDNINLHGRLSRLEGLFEAHADSALRSSDAISHKIDNLADKIGIKLDTTDKRVSSLENSKSYMAGIYACIGAILTFLLNKVLKI